MESHLHPAQPAVHTVRSPFRSAAPVSMALLLSACAWEQYEADPLRGEEFAALVEERSPEADPIEGPQGPLTLARAVDWLRSRGPRVRETIARYHTALALAGVPTPWPNPSISVGPNFGYGPDVVIHKVTPSAGLNLRIPVSGRLGRQDEVNAALAEAARADALATFRELYLELRAAYVRLAVSQRRETVRAAVLDGARSSLAASQDLIAAGVATALDVSLFQLEHARERGRMLGARLQHANAAADLSALVAVSAAQFGELPPDALPTVPKDLPSALALRERIVMENPRLLRLRAEYQVAERQLHLEIARQYPDLVFGTTFLSETGERKNVLGLTLGIQLPIFDRNQQPIARARKRREEVRVRYESDAHRVLNAVERALATLELAAAQHQVLRDEVLPAARENVAIARQSLAAGATGALQVLDAERSFRQVEVEALEAQLSEQMAWSGLEQAVGVPLVEFGSDPTDAGRTPPADLEDRDDSESDGGER